jgi:hypothetical protein
MRGTLRMPKAMVAASKPPPGKGRASALASTKRTALSSRRWTARSRPTVSMPPLMSATVTCAPSLRRAMRNAMSPVPPATSSTV